MGTQLGCQEYNITDANPVTGTANPPAVEPPVREDNIVQVTTPKVDVLWVIDNSGSMSDEQDELAVNFPAFMSYFVDSGLDWHVGVVSTDMDNPGHSGKLREAAGQRYLTPEVDEPVEVFKNMARMGASGSGTERGRLAAYTAIEVLGDSFNAGFYREEASLSIIVISDEDDHTTKSQLSRNEFISWLKNLKRDRDLVSFSSIVCPDASDCAETIPGFFPIFGGMQVDDATGADYLAVTDAVGGVAWGIRSSDWSQMLDELGMQAAGLKREFFLADIPVQSTIEVVVNTRDGHTYDQFKPDVDWVYSPTRNSVQFVEFIPPALSDVNISYELLAASSYGGADAEDTGR